MFGYRSDITQMSLFPEKDHTDCCKHHGCLHDDVNCPTLPPISMMSEDAFCVECANDQARWDDMCRFVN